MNSAWREKLAVSLTSVATRLAACNCGKPVGIRWGVATVIPTFLLRLVLQPEKVLDLHDLGQQLDNFSMASCPQPWLALFFRSWLLLCCCCRSGSGQSA